MALPTFPTVVVLENDASVFAPNVDSSIVGIVGFADKGPIDEATLVTSQADLINQFGKPSSNIPGQALEGALEILEATNKVYFVRAATDDAAVASSIVTVGFCPTIQIPTSSLAAASSVICTVYDNYGVLQSTRTVNIGAGDPVSSYLANFNKDLVNDSVAIATTDSNSNLFLAGRYAGAAASISLSSLGTFSFSSLNSNSVAVGVGSYVTASGGTAIATGASSLYLLAETVYKGSGYALSSLRDGTVVGLSIEVDSKSFRDKITVNSDGAERESFLVELSPSSPASIEYLLNTDVANNTSDYVNAQLKASGADYTANDNPANVLPSQRSFTYGGSVVYSTPRFVKFVEGTYNVTGGHSGYSTSEFGSTDDKTALIGSSSDKTGLYALDDDSLNISIALIPGITSQNVQNALITLAEETKKFISIVSPPYGLDTVQDATDWINGRSDSRTAAINSSYAAAYWPWVQVFNVFAAADEWYDPAIFAARQYVYTDNVAEPWYAPAFYRRGRLTKPTDVEIRLSDGDKGVLYDNNLNPIAKENQYGITIIGQKTTQRNPTSLQSVNVRRLMIEIRKTLLILGKPFQGEPNDEFTWELVRDAVEPFIDDLIRNRAITEGAVACDSSTNTPLRRDRKELWCSVTIKPTLAAETIVFEVNLTNQSATITG